MVIIIELKPLFLFLERKAIGLRICGIPQCLEAYCDDINILTNKDSDILIVESAIMKFEAVSGAILSRNKKCKVLGFGTWKDRVAWPLHTLPEDCEGVESVWDFLF